MIYLFLGSLRATVIPGVAVPLSLIGTFGVMKLWGFSLDNLSLMALTISTGFVVDDAIVMVENVSRFIEHGDRPFEAALKGAKQIGFTIVSLTVSLVAVLIPLLFMGGLVGRLFREFAVTLAIAIVLSAILSLTLTAMMCAWILRPHAEQHPGALARSFERGFTGLGRFYDRTLQVVLRHQRTTLLVTLATLAVTVGLAFHVPKGFFPVEDTGMIVGVTEAAPDVSFGTMMVLQQRAAEAVLTDPDVATVSSFIGADGTNPTQNSGRLSIALTSRDDRDADVTEVIARLQARLAGVQGITVYLQPVQDLTVDARIARTQYQYTIEDPDPAELAAWAPRMLDAMRGLPALRDVASDQQTAGLELHLAVDRDSASRLGITAQALDDTLYDAFGQRIVSTTFTQLNQYRIILELRPEDRENIDSLDRIYVRSGAGAAIPLSAFARLETRSTALAIDHEGQFPSVTLSFNTAPGVSLGEAISAIDGAAERLVPAAGDARRVPGRRRGVPRIAGVRAAADPRRADHRLHRARRPVRELHPPDHDPVDAAVGGRRRDPGARADRQAVRRDLADRHRAADRHRQEERDHDDRLRAGGRARAAHVARAVDLPGLHAAVPPDHDDHDGGAARRPAARAGLGHRRRAAPAARHHDRRRPAGVADPDPVHHAGDLPDDGPDRAAVVAPPRRTRRDAGRAGCRVNLSAPFIRRPKATWLLAAALLLAGAAAFTHLPVAPLPKIDFPTIHVNANLPGASPLTMATAVAMPLERRFGRIAGVSEITSQSSLGTTGVIVQFDMDRDVEGAARDIQAAINAAGGDLPPNLPTRPDYHKVNPSDAPILIISLRSKSLPLPAVFEAANTVLAQKLAQVPGVGQVGVGGGVQPAVRVQVDPAVLAGLGIGLEDVRNALASATSNQPKGSVGSTQWHTLGVDDQLLDADAWKNVIIHWAQPGGAPAIDPAAAAAGATGAPAIAAPTSTFVPAAGAAAAAGVARGDVGGGIRLGDIASVKDDVENQRVAGWFDGERTVMVFIRRQPGANILDVIDRIKQLLPELTHAISPAIDVAIAIDRSSSIRAVGARRRALAADQHLAGRAGRVRVPAQRRGRPRSPAWRCRCR